VTLFDGKTLDGWVQRNGTASFRIADGAIVGRTREGSPNSFLTTEQDYGDFELEFEVRVDDALNSGVQIRSRTRPRSTGEGADERAGRVFGPQVEIEASPGLAGFIYGEATRRGWLTPEERLEPHEHFRNGAWNRYRIVAHGPRIRTWVNGQPIEDLTDEEIYRGHPEGFIGLQVHSIEPGSGPNEVAWRRLRLRELPPSE
jgi:3-keto-disaccharide hydrolase